MSALDVAAHLEAVIRRFIATSPENTLRDAANERAWADPAIGFSNGADPLYAFYKADIGAFYRSPLEFFIHAFPRATVSAEGLSVVSWVLPHTDATKAEHGTRTQLPTERWARARIYGEAANDQLRRTVVSELARVGIDAVAPMLSPLWRRRHSSRYGFASAWSERHAAYAAGLGTFGLCDGLITPKGKAMRCGSVVAHAAIPPSARAYTDHHAYCLHYAKGTCGRCIARCPAGALSRDGHDKARCSAYLRATRRYVRATYGFDGYGCGLCQTGVPCESGIPAALAP
jgi:epoxyqueuosine reductase QueG